jgi:hypothetical protein
LDEIRQRRAAARSGKQTSSKAQKEFKESELPCGNEIGSLISMGYSSLDAFALTQKAAVS